MAGISSVTLPHATIPTQMFGNVNLQNAVMYVNDNFKALLDGTNANATATNDALKAKSDATHAHDEAYAAIGHIHQWQDIQGLSVMLDGKAELNHEHAQYLSSLPAHFHDINSVNGLTDIVNGKSDVSHRHNVGDIDELATELGNKASATYVDQQVANIGSSIQPIVEDVVEKKGFAKVAPNTYGQGQEYTTAEALAATHPKDDAAIPANETANQKQAREIADIGTSAKAARADHQHRMVFSTTNPSQVGGASASPGTGIYPARFDHVHPLSPGVATWYRPERTTLNLVSIEADGIVDSGQPKPSQGFRFVQGAINGVVEGYLVEGGAANTDSIRNSGIKADDVLVNDESDPYVKQSDVEETAGSIADEKITTFSGTLPNLYAAKSTEATVATNTANITTNTNGISALDVRVTALENQPPSGGGTVKSVDGVQPTSNGNVALGALTEDDIGDTVQPYDAALETLAENLTDAGKVPFASIDGSISGHSGNCLMYVNGSGVVGHVGDGTGGNDIYNLVAGVNKDGTKIITDDDIGNGLIADDSGNILVQCKADGGIGVGGDGIYLGGLIGTGFVKSDGGTMSIPAEQPITAPSGSGYLKKTGDAVSVTSPIPAGDVDGMEELVDSVSGLISDVNEHEERIDTLEASSELALTEEDVGVTVQAYNEGLETLAGSLDNGKVPLSQLTGKPGGSSHSGNCLVTCDTNGALGHSGNTAFNLLANAAYSNGVMPGTSRNANKIITDLDIGNGLEADATTHNIKVKCKTNGGIGVDSDGVYLGGLSGTGFVKSENGAMSIPADQPITASGDGFLKKSGTTVSGTTIAIGDVTDLQTALNGKAASVHTHTIANVDGLQDALDKKVNDTDLGDAAYGTIGEDVQAYNANLTSLTEHLDGNGRVSLETGVYSTAGTTGIVGVENGVVDVRDAIGTDLVTYDGTNTLDDVIGNDGKVAASHVNLGNGLEASSSDAVQVKCKTNGGISATSDGLEVSGVATYDTDNPPTSPSIVSMDADGFLADECALPMTAPSSNKVLTCKSGGTALSWEDGMTVGTQLTPSPQSGANLPVDSAGDNFLNQSGFTPPAVTTWTRGGQTPTGVMITVCTGVKKHDGSSAYRSAVFSNLYFDENGCLCKIETAKNWYRVQ